MVMKKPQLRNWVWIGTPVLIVLALLVWPYIASGQKADQSPTFEQSSMTIQRADGQSFLYSVEVALTREQEAYGLMFRRSLPTNAGMIFVYNPDQLVSMWMKNTYIPLDMLFVRKDGIIVKIITHAQPFDLTPLPSGEPVRGVIELNAGDVERNGLKTGDKVIFSAFSQ